MATDTVATSSEKYNYLWKTVISYKMSELLEIVRDRYPTDIKDVDIREIVDNIRKRLILSTSDSSGNDTDSGDSVKPATNSKIRKRKEIPLEERCLARCWVATDVNGKQCSRRKNAESGLCQQHEANLPHGLITDPITKHLKANFQKYGKSLEGSAERH